MQTTEQHCAYKNTPGLQLPHHLLCALRSVAHVSMMPLSFSTISE